MVDKELDIEWPLDENVKLRVTRLSGDIYDLEDFNSDRKLRLSWEHGIGDEGSRMLFDGEDIETEDYMAYLGLMDEVVDRLQPTGVGTVILDPEF